MAASSHEFTKTQNEFRYAGIVWSAYTTPELVRRSESFQFLPSDICVCTFMRSGTTLTQEIVWHILHCDEIEKGRKYGDIDERFPFLEFDYKYGDGNQHKQYAIDTLQQQQQQQKQPRLIKTHCPYSLIGPQLTAAKPKIICVARNPKDCCVSLYKFYKGLDMYGPWPGDMQEFVRLFLAGCTMGGDYFKVNAEWWKLRDEDNVVFVKYEDLVKRPRESVLQIAKFLGREITQEQLDIIVHNTSFGTMSRNENVNYTFETGFQFLRKGVIGDWKSELTQEQSSQIDAAYQQRLLPLGLSFEFE